MNLVDQDLENLKRLSLRWMIRKGINLAEAEDLFQQSVLKAITTETHLADQQKLQSWFMSILKNTMLDFVRSRKLHSEKEKIYQTEKELLQEEQELENSFCKCASKFLDQLPSEDRTLLQEHFFEGKTFTHLAKSSGQAEGNLRVKSLRAREKLKDMFQACCKVRKFQDLEDCGCE